MDESTPTDDATPDASGTPTDADATPEDGATGEADAIPPAERHAARAAVYSAAAGALCYPDEDLVTELTHDDAAEGLRAAGRKLDLGEEVEALLAALDATDRDALESAYNRLFGLPGDGGTYPVTPYEAEYTVGDDVGHKQRRVATVVGLLEALGVEPADRFDERGDHVVVELELVQVLAARRAVARERGEDGEADDLERVEATVLDEHLADFVPAFAHDVREATASGERPTGDGKAKPGHAVYEAAADLAAAMVARDLATHPEPDVDADPERGVRSRA